MKHNIARLLAILILWTALPNLALAQGGPGDTTPPLSVEDPNAAFGDETTGVNADPAPIEEIAPAAAEPATYTSGGGGSVYVSNQVLVKFKPNTTEGQFQQMLARHGIQWLRRHRGLGWCLLSVPRGRGARAFLSFLQNDPDVESAELNGVIFAGAVPTDPLYSAIYSFNNVPVQWALRNIHMEGAWSQTQGYSGYIIAILDSGVKADHPDLVNKLVRNPNGSLLGFNRVNPGQYPYDDEQSVGHGTFVAGIAAAQTTFDANNRIGIAGVSPGARILPVKVFNSGNHGFYGDPSNVTFYDLAGAIDDAATVPGVRVINLSGFGYPANILNSQRVYEAIKRANDKGILFVTIMGNRIVGDNPPPGYTPDPPLGEPTLPGAYWNVMAVSATDINDQRASYSKVGLYNSAAAPGGDAPTAAYPWPSTTVKVYSTALVPNYLPEPYSGSDFYNYGFGTSFAAPHVAGLAHLVLSRFSSMTWWDLKARIEDTADDTNAATLPYKDNELGWGRINAERAVTPETPASSLTFSPGINMVSIPFWPSGLDPNNTSSARTQDFSRVFPGAGIVLTGSKATGNMVWWWDPTTVSYLPYTNPRVPRLGPGRSYWIRFPGSSSVTASRDGAYTFKYVGQRHPAVSHLTPFWNLIGTPSTTAIVWDTSRIRVRSYDSNKMVVEQTLAQAKASGWIEDVAYRYNPQSGQYEVVGQGAQLTPGVGYFLKANRECELLLPAQ